MDIKNYICEATQYDKKQEVERKKVKNWLKSVSAFANGDGGRLLFGISDDDEVVGLEDAKADAEFVSQKIKERIDPVPQILMEIEKIDGKDVLSVYVEPGTDSPYYYMGDGQLETFVRIGNETVVADAVDHKRLVLRGRNSSFDACLSSEKFDDFAFTKLRERYYKWNGVSFDPKLFRSFGMVDKDGCLTNAGLLMADECNLRQSRVFCTRWNGKTKGSGRIDALDSAEITGSLVRLLEDSMNFIRRNMRTLWFKDPEERIEVPEYLERSVMEAVVNALAHRDYLIVGSEVHVDMYDDRLVIYSPGSMPEGRLIQELDFDNIPSVRRNPVIADVLAQLGYMERKGSGMGKILNPYKVLPYLQDAMLPVFFSDRAQFTITFPNIVDVWKNQHPNIDMYEVEETTEGDVPHDDPRDVPSNVPHEIDFPQWIEGMIKMYPNITTSELASLSGKSSKTVKRNIAKSNRIKYVGRGHYGYWEIDGQRISR